MTRVPKLDICLPIREGWSAPSSVPCLCAAECAKITDESTRINNFKGPVDPIYTTSAQNLFFQFAWDRVC